MIFVLGIFGVFLFYALFFTEDMYEKYLLLMPVLILSVYTGTRMNVGGYDYHVYKYFYELPYFQNPYGYEKLFVILRDTSKFMGLNYNYFLLVLSFIFNFIVYKLIVNYSVYPTLSFLIYLSTFYYWHNFTIIRNFIAILLFWVSLKYVLERKPVAYFLIITIACFFHKTAIILYPLYFLLNYKFNKKALIILFGLACFINPISFLIFKMKINFLGLSERLNRYSNIIEHGNFYDFCELLILVFIMLFFKKYADAKNNIMLNLNILALFIFIAFYRFAIMIRFLEYFRLGIFIFIPFLLSKIKDRHIRYLCFILFCTYFTGRYYNIVSAYAVYNYESWLSSI